MSETGKSDLTMKQKLKDVSKVDSSSHHPLDTQTITKGTPLAKPKTQEQAWKDLFGRNDIFSGSSLDQVKKKMDFNGMNLSEMAEKAKEHNKEYKDLADISHDLQKDSSKQKFDFEAFRTQCTEFDENTKALNDSQANTEDLARKLTESANKIDELQKDYCTKVLKDKGMDLITDQILLGPETGAENPDEVRFIGGRLIVDMRKPEEGQHNPEALKKWNIQLREAPTSDGGDVSTKDLKEIAEEIANHVDAGGRVMVHCKNGTGRSPQAVIAALMKTKRIKFIDAKKEVEANHKISTLSPTVMKALKSFEKEWSSPKSS